MEVTTARVLDTRRMLKRSNKFRLAIRVTFNRKPVLFPVNLSATKDEFRKLSSPRIGKQLCEIRDQFLREEERAKRIIANLGTFTFPAFRERFYKESTFRNRKPVARRKGAAANGQFETETQPAKRPEGKTKKYGKTRFDKIRSNVNFEAMGPLAVAFGEYIKLLEAQERIGTSESYFTALLSLMRFRKHLRLEDVDVFFLYAYEKWLRSKKLSDTTIGIYIRNLRAIINLPKNKKLFDEETYPFGRGKYQIPTGVNVKKALDLLDIKKIYEYQPQTNEKNEMFARDMWLFGYFANGINPKDIASLKYKNIDEDGFFVLRREKTKHTTRSKPKNIIIPINEDMERIMNTWGNQDKSPENYIFPVFEPDISPHRKYELLQYFNRTINDWMRVIAANLGINKKVRTMEYRHTMATVLKRSGATTEFIQEAMGHENKSTTENYLSSFDFETKKHFARNLLAFKDIKEEQV